MIEITSQFQITNALRGEFSSRRGGCGAITPAESYFRLNNAATCSADASVLELLRSQSEEVDLKLWSGGIHAKWPDAPLSRPTSSQGRYISDASAWTFSGPPLSQLLGAVRANVSGSATNCTATQLF